MKLNWNFQRGGGGQGGGASLVWLIFRTTHNTGQGKILQKYFYGYWGRSLFKGKRLKARVDLNLLC